MLIFNFTERCFMLFYYHYNNGKLFIVVISPACNYMFKGNSRNTRTMCEICSKLTLLTLLTLNMFHTLF